MAFATGAVSFLAGYGMIEVADLEIPNLVP